MELKRRGSEFAAGLINLGRRLTSVQDTLFESSEDVPHPHPSTSMSVIRRQSHLIGELLNKTLHEAAREGNAEAIEVILARTSEKNRRKKANERDEYDLTPLHYAAKNHSYKGMKLLIKYKADIRAKDEDGLTPLHHLAKNIERVKDLDDLNKNENPLKLLVENGALLWDKDLGGLAPLHHACISGNTTVVNDILNFPSIDLEDTDNQGMTPLHHACWNGNLEISKILIEKGAFITAEDTELLTPFHIACAVGNLEIAKLLVQSYGKETSRNDETNQFEITIETEEETEVDMTLVEAASLIEASDANGNLPIHLAVEGGYQNLVKYILEISEAAGLSNMVNRCRAGKTSCLHLAVLSNKLNIVKLLIDKKSNIDIQNESLATPLSIACKQNSHEVVDLLLQNGAKANVKDAENMTALLITSRYGHVETLEHLLEYDIDLSDVDNDKKNCLMWAAEENHVAVIQILMKRPEVRNMVENRDLYSNTALHLASNKGNEESVQVLLELCGATADAKNKADRTTLHVAALQGHNSIISDLILKHRTIINCTDEEANTALHLAALGRNVKSVIELIQLGANIELKNNKQWTPLHCAAFAGFEKAAIALLEAGAIIQPIKKFKVSPMHLACKKGHVGIVRILLQWRADVAFKSPDGRNSLDFALDFQHKECAYALIQHSTWQDSLKNAVRNPNTGITDTPMRKLIRKMPDLAEIALDKCMYDNGKRPIDKDFAVTMVYEFLDDTYSCSKWLNQMHMVRQISLSDNGRNNQLNGNEEPNVSIYDGDEIPLSSSHTYSRSSSKLKKNHPLNIMADEKCEKLLVHPLVSALLDFKWKNCVRYVYYSSTLFFVTFLIMLNHYVLLTPQFYRIDWQKLYSERTGINTSSSCFFYRNDIMVSLNLKTGCNILPKTHNTERQLLLFYAAIQIFLEICVVVPRRKTIKISKILELLLYSLCILVTLNFEYFRFNSGLKTLTSNNISNLTVFDNLQSQTGIRQEWQESLAAFAIFLSWIGLIIHIQKLPILADAGIYVTMLTVILMTFAQFLMVFIFFIIGFGLAFYILLGNQMVFETWYDSIVTTFIMMMGELDYSGKFYPSSSGYADQNYTKVASYVLYLTFSIVMTILIMNLLVGLAVGDIMEIQKEATIQRIGMQIDSSLDVEFFFPSWVRRRFTRKKEVIEDNRGRLKLFIIRIFRLNPNRFKPSILRKFHDQMHEDDFEENNNQLSESNQIISSLTNLRSRLNDIYDEQGDLRQRVKKVDLILMSTRTEAKAYSEDLMATLSDTSLELNKTISSTKSALKYTTEDESNTTRGQVQNTLQLVASLRIDIHKTHEFLEKAKIVLISEIQASTTICTSRLQFLDVISSKISDCDKSVNVSRVDVLKQIIQMKNLLLEDLSLKIGKCNHQIIQTDEEIKEKLVSGNTEVKELMEINFRICNELIDNSKMITGKEIELTKSILQKTIDDNITDCKEHVTVCKDEIWEYFTEKQNNLGEKVAEFSDKCVDNVEKCKLQLEELIKSSQTLLEEKMEEKAIWCKNNFDEGHKSLISILTKNETEISNQLNINSKEINENIINCCKQLEEKINETKEIFLDEIGTNHNQLIKNNTEVADKLSTEVGKGNQNLIEKINDNIETCKEEMKVLNIGLKGCIAASSESLLDRCKAFDVLQSNLTICEEKVEISKDTVKEEIRNTSNKLLEEISSVAEVKAELQNCNEQVGNVIQILNTQSKENEKKEAYTEERLTKIENNVCWNKEKLLSLEENLKTDFSVMKENILENLSNIDELKSQINLCNQSIEEMNEKFVKSFDKVNDFLHHLTKSVKYVIETQEEFKLASLSKSKK